MSSDPAEMAGRTARVRAAMAAAGIGVLVAFDSNDKLTGGNARYLAGSPRGPLPAPSYVVVGLEGDVKLVVTENRARTVGNHARSFAAPNTDLIVVPPGTSAAAAIADAARALGSKGRTVGLDGIATSGEVATQLAGAGAAQEVRNAAGTVERVRRQKSPAELELCGRATALAHQVFASFQEAVQPGVPQGVAVSEAAALAAQLGGEELVLVLGSGRPWVWSSATPWRSPNTFESDQPVSCEVNVRVGGYFAQVARSWHIGTVSDLHLRMIDAVQHAHAAMVGELAVGAVPCEVFRSGLAEIERHGFGYGGIRYGHGLGFTIAEGWDFGDDDDDPDGVTRSPLCESAFGVCHPFLFDADDAGTVRFNALHGDPWALRINGAVTAW